MAVKKPGGRAPRSERGDYIVLNGQRLQLVQHDTDFSVLAGKEGLDPKLFPKTARLSRKIVRASAKNAEERDRLMDEVRHEKVAHHIYQVEGTGEEIVIDDRIILNLRREGTGELEKIMREYHLKHEGRMGDAHVLRLTNLTGKNPIKVANEIAERPEVASCSPQVLVELQRHDAPALFGDQWYLAADLTTNPDVLEDSDIDVPEAWEITRGRPEVVVAVIDDGFDLGHPALQGVRLHPDRKDFVDGNQDPEPSADDYHGTPVSSIVVGAHRPGSAMRGIAPDCTFLPVRIGFGPAAPPIDILEVFRYVSQRADVVNCSFGLPPSSFDRLDANFRSEITRLTQTGGRRGKGLVMVFSAANDDAPTFLEGAQNVNGVKYTGFTASGAAVIQTIPAGRSVFSGYPMTTGVVTVGAMSSLKRKSGYSSWGPHLTVTAPSNNMHYIMAFVAPGTPGRDAFVASYRGLGQVAGANRPGHGSPFSPIARFDDPTTTELQENIYTRNFGGTSGAAPVVTGVAALMISVNLELSAQEVRQILMSTADRDLDQVLDLANDPNVQGLSGAFAAGRSLFFGSGKVNALHAVRRARSLGPEEPAPEPPPVVGPAAGRKLSIGTKANLEIPDNQPQGVTSRIEICASGRATAIAVDVDVTHPYRGDLTVTLIAPNGRTARLHQMAGGAERDLKRTFSSADTPELAALIATNVDVHGQWSLHVSDNLNRDVGRLNTWFLDVEFQSS